MAKKSESVTESVVVRPSTAVKAIRHCMNKKRPIMLWGPPGIGKSDIINDIGKTYEQRDSEGNLIMPERPIIDIRLLLHDPTDLKGMPYFDFKEGRMKWSQPSELPMVVSWEDIQKCDADLKEAQEDLKNLRSQASVDHAQVTEVRSRVEALENRHKLLTGAHAMQNAIIFLDELVAAPQTVQGAAYQLILNRKIGEYTLPDGVDIVAAGNRETDRGVSFRMPKPLQNRFIHFTLDVNFEDWQSWAVNNSISADVVGFLSHHTQHLFNFDPKSPSNAFATPRSWKFLSDLIGDDCPFSDDELFPIVAGTIGDGVAMEFITHKKCAAKLPNPMAILTGEEKAPLKVKEVSAMYSLVISMCYRLKDTYDIACDNEKSGATGKNVLDMDLWHTYVDNFFSYMLKNFQPEMCVLGAKIALRDYKIRINPKKTKSFSDFYEKYASFVLDK